ncbi:MAG: glycerol-3-phosphate 1-O-acyltransferase PlsY [Peptostreptococcaceae bacterium]|nr:glycerol-3-phosphate 1-O-acyltransferase PlsY [Peptostreptococcaceae bacterium]
MKLFICVLLILLAYLLGNISPSTLIGKMKGVDIKKEGSGNAGTTNALRVLGAKAGVLTFALDILKGFIAVWLALQFSTFYCACICVIAVMLGHIWPVIYKFKGGKGVATAIGATLAINPIVTLVVTAFSLGTIAVTKKVSIGSLLAAVIYPIATFIFMRKFFPFALIICLIIIIKHRENIRRLKKGEEKNITVKKEK